MRFEHIITDEQIRHRAYCIWEADGHRPGLCHEHWLRAREELEEEFERSLLVALAEKETTDLVMPHPSISMPPCRSESARIDPDSLRQAA